MIVAVRPEALAVGLAGVLSVDIAPVAWPEPVAEKYAHAPVASAIATSRVVARRVGLGLKGSLMDWWPSRYRRGSRWRPGIRSG